MARNANELSVLQDEILEVRYHRDPELIVSSIGDFVFYVVFD